MKTLNFTKNFIFLNITIILFIFLFNHSVGIAQINDEAIYKNEERRKILLKETAKIEGINFDKRISNLRKIIELNPSPDNKITQIAYEMLIVDCIGKAGLIRNKDERSEYLLSIQEDFQKLYNYFYPDKFQYSLKGKNSFQILMRYYLWRDNPQKAIEIFHEFLESGIPIDESINIFTLAIRSNLQKDDTYEVDYLINQISQFLENNIDYREDQLMILSYIENYRNITDYYYTQNDHANALIFAEIYHKVGMGFIEKTGFVKGNKTFRLNFTRTLIKFAKEYNFLHQEAIENLELEIINDDGWPPIRYEDGHDCHLRTCHSHWLCHYSGAKSTTRISCRVSKNTV